MKIRWHGMLGTNHSWAFTQQALARAMVATGKHEVFLKSTNGLKHFPDDLKSALLPGYHCHQQQPFLPHFMDQYGNVAEVAKQGQGGPPEIPDKHRPYDLDIAYTIFMQGPRRFFPETPCKMLIWNFESSILPPGWHMYHRSVDYFLPSSQYSSDIFTNSGVPKEQSIVVPHGVYRDMFNPDIPPFKLRTQKKVKFLHCAIPHHRKLHDRVLAAYLEAFTGDDDVCLVMKTKLKPPDKDKPFEVNVKTIIENALKGRKNPPEIEVVQTFVPDIGSLYTACDSVVSMSSCEGFWLPGLEALACGPVVIAPRHGGQLDFLNDDNSLLVDAGEMIAPKSMQYWHYHKESVVGDPDITHCAELMRRVYENTEGEKARVAEAREKTVSEFTWDRPAQMILDLAEETVARKRSNPKPARRTVLYIVPYGMAGGAETWIREAIQKLDKDRYKASIAFPSGISPQLREVFGDLDVGLEDLRTQGHGFALKALIESEKPDIVHFHNSLQVYKLLLGCLKDGAWRGRVVETAHSELVWNDSMAKIAARRGVSLILSVSSTLAKKLRKQGNRNVAVLPQQVDWNRFRIPRSKEVLEAEDLPSSGFTVGMVARLSPEKNLPLLLKCAKMMPDATFIVVGNGPQEKVLKQMARNIHNVRFVGRRTDVERFYAAFDALLITSSMEGMPLVALEAMAAGTPVISGAIGAMGEILASGKNGFLVANHTRPEGFIEGLRKLRDPAIWQPCSDGAQTLAGEMERRGQEDDINKYYDMLFSR